MKRAERTRMKEGKDKGPLGHKMGQGEREQAESKWNLGISISQSHYCMCWLGSWFWGARS